MIEITTDAHPDETSWTLRLVGDQQIDAGGCFYSEENFTYKIEHCLDENTEYVFTLIDSWGDGICCGYGSGSYTINWNGE